MTKDRRHGLYQGFSYRLEIEDVPVAGFSEVSGMNFDKESVEYREHDELQPDIRKLPGANKYSYITLKRGVSYEPEFWDWCKSSLKGVIYPRYGTIILQDEEHSDFIKWRFKNGWISKLEGPALNATDNELMIETLVISHEGLDVEVDP